MCIWIGWPAWPRPAVSTCGKTRATVFLWTIFHKWLCNYHVWFKVPHCVQWLMITWNTTGSSFVTFWLWRKDRMSQNVTVTLLFLYFCFFAIDFFFWRRKQKKDYIVFLLMHKLNFYMTGSNWLSNTLNSVEGVITVKHRTASLMVCECSARRAHISNTF